MKVGKILKISFLAIFVIACCITIPIGYGYYIVKLQKADVDENVYLYITNDDNAASVAQKLSQITDNGNVKGFELLAKHNDFDKRKRSGKFVIRKGDNMHAIYRRIVSNEQTPVKLVIPATRTIEQLTGAISRQLMLDSLELSEFLTKPIYYESIGYSKETLPSLFIPNTYEVYWNIKPENLMTRLMNERRKFWNDSRTSKAKKLGMTPEEVAANAQAAYEKNY